MFPEINVELLTFEVSRRPELWDTTLECYKDKNRKKTSWLRLCSKLFHQFDTLKDKEKFFIAKAVNEKWHTVRDGYVKSRRKEKALKKLGLTTPPQKYVHSHLLSFLDKCLDIQEVTCCEPREETKVAVGSEFPTGLTVKTNLPHIKPSQSHLPAANIPLVNEDHTNDNDDNHQTTSNSPPTRNLLLQSLKQQSDEEDDDLAFFRSLLPMLKPLSHPTKLRFRIKVMNSLQMVVQQGSTVHDPKLEHLSSRRYKPYQLQEMAVLCPQPSQSPSTFVSQSSE